MNYRRTVLENGLRVITVPMPSFESATVLVMVGAGSRYEKRSNNGVSHFLEHMAFKGTEKRPTAMEISSLIDGMGGEFNAFTGKEITGYYIKSSVNHVDLCLDVLSDMLLNSKLDSIEIEKEKGVILEEKNLYEDTPARKIGDLYEELLYGDTPMGWDIIGTKEVIKKMTREDFISYMNSLYSADNITVVVAGGITNDKAEALVKKYFSIMKRFDTIRATKVIEDQKKPEIMIKEKKTEQVHIALGVRAIPIDHPDRYPLEVLSSILGGGMSSRLFHEIRENRGLGYYVRTSADSYEDCGTLVTTAGVDPKRVEEAVKVIIEEYHDIREGNNGKRLKVEEVRKAKDFLKGHFVLELEDSRSVASFYANQELLEKRIDTPAEVLEKIDKVTVEQIQEVAKKYLQTETLNLAVIGNFSDGHNFDKLLRL